MAQFFMWICRERDCWNEKTAPVSFRTRLQIAMMLLIAGITAVALSVAQRHAASETQRDLEREFQTELAALQEAREVRQAALVERCRTLVGKARIHAALEDNALDLLYLTALDELRDVVEGRNNGSPVGQSSLRARFYRFLDSTGAVINPATSEDVGPLRPEDANRLSLPGVPVRQQIGYLLRREQDSVEVVDEVIAMPIISNETAQPIAAIVLGFKPIELGGKRRDLSVKRGIWLGDGLYMPAVAKPAQIAVGHEVARAVADNKVENNVSMAIDGTPHLLFYKRLNPDSLYPPAYEVSVYPLTELLARKRQLRWRAMAAGAALLFGGLVASHFVSRRLSRPVERLEVESAEARTQRERAEAALESTSEELQRAARFSADASHQLKTPITVLRAGLEELLARDVEPEVRDEICALVHQTYRVTNIIEDLLLLSRMDAGRLELEFAPVDVKLLIERWVDDLSALPDPFHLEVETDLPANLRVLGEKRYTSIILQNLLENARKYNRAGGRIQIRGRNENGWVSLIVGNTGPPIAPGARDHVFERFHRGSAGENVPGYGLGLNLARELARIHHGDLRLVRSDETWTEFEVRFHSADEQPLPDGQRTA